MKPLPTPFLGMIAVLVLFIVGAVVSIPKPLCEGKTAYYLPVGDHYQVSCDKGDINF